MRRTFRSPSERDFLPEEYVRVVWRMRCLIPDETSINILEGWGADVLLEELQENSEATVEFLEGGVPCAVRRVDGKLYVVWKPSKKMKKKEELLDFPDSQAVSVSRFQPFFKFVNTNGSRLVRCLLVDNGFLEVLPESTLFDAFWTGKHIKKSLLQGFGPSQKINHFPKTYEITRKDRLFKNVERMDELHPGRGFNFLPKTFVLPEEHDLLRKELFKSDERWILKPNSSSRGRGIFIIRDLLDISPASIEKCVVCKYIANPLIINGLKFDLRIYVGVSSFFPLRVWMYEEDSEQAQGLARFATEPYRDDGFKNPFIHLTNYSINKKSKKFELLNQDLRDDDLHEASGSKWTLTAFRRFLRENGVDDVALWKKIEACVARALISVEHICAPAMQEWANYRTSCYELFGFDVLLDDNLNPWVLEVNLSPSLSIESNLDFGVKSKMLSDLFNIVGFGVFDRPAQCGIEAVLAQELSDSGECLSDEKKPFSDEFTTEDLQVMAKETKQEMDRSGGWKMLVPAMDDSFDDFFPEKRRPAYKYIRGFLAAQAK